MSLKLLKVDFHIHTQEDPHDYIPYDSYRLVDIMASKGYDAIAVTNHNRFTYSLHLRDYAKERGIVFIRGIERTVWRRHVLLVNFGGEAGDYNSLKDIEKAKRPDNLVIAAHPYFPMPTASGSLISARPAAFDAIEYCHYYVRGINFNNRAVAESYNRDIPLVGNSDAHTSRQLDRTYSLVEAEDKSPEAIIEAIKAGRVRVMTRPFKARTLITISSLISLRNFRGRMRCLLENGRYGYRGPAWTEPVG